jgi:capsular polysaccharide export protein
MAGHLAVEYMIAERVTVLDGGQLGKVLDRSRAVVTVNSTVGSEALARGLPVITLGKAVYDIPGLTFQGELDDFWRAAAPPDAALFDAFRRVLIDRCLIPGSFFNEIGLRLAVEAAVDRLEAAYARPASGRALERAGGSASSATPIAVAGRT